MDGPDDGPDDPAHDGSEYKAVVNICTHLNADGSVNVCLENLEPGHIGLWFTDRFAGAVAAAVWAHQEAAKTMGEN
jgi:hypothetical protein